MYKYTHMYTNTDIKVIPLTQCNYFNVHYLYINSI